MVLLKRLCFFPSFGSAADIKSVLLREFPRLEESGGFEIFRTMENFRVFLMVTCVGAYTMDELMQMSSGRIFVRPIQSSLHIDETKRTLVSSDFQKCQIHGSLINLADFREHSKECRKMNDELPDPMSTNDEEDILEEYVDYSQFSNRAESDSGNSDITPLPQQSEKNESWKKRSRERENYPWRYSKIYHRKRMGACVRLQPRISFEEMINGSLFPNPQHASIVFICTYQGF